MKIVPKDLHPRIRSMDQRSMPLAASLAADTNFIESMYQHRCRLLRVARRILQNEDDAEDAVQDAYLNAVRHSSQFAGRSSFLTWLTRIVVNQAVGQLRMKRSQPRIEKMSVSDCADGIVCVSKSRNLQQQLLHSERHRGLRTALKKIPIQYRTVIQLRQFEQMSIAEAADWLGITEACIKTRLHRANHLLRRHLGGPRLVKYSCSATVVSK